MSAAKALLGAVDYLFIALMLLISAGIGIYFSIVGGKQKTTEEFLLAGKNMSILPVAFSIMATVFSAITILGKPAEMYNFGIPLTLTNVGIIFGKVTTSYLFLPVYFEMQATTSYEYLEKRFGKIIRILSSMSFVAQMMLYMAVVLYAPALALSAVTNLSTWASVISIGVVCTFYCTLGGMKAVVWTDVFQAILMYFCIIAVLIKGCMDIGGIENAMWIASKGGRLKMPGIEIDPTVRYTIWNLFLQGFVTSMAASGSNQIQVQRLLAVKNVKKSRIALLLSIPLSVVFNLMTALAGLVIYANLAGCDPLTSEEKPISSADQLLPYYVMKSFRDVPGLPGLCICGVLSASLSTVSSAVNSLATVTMEDFIKRFWDASKTEQWKLTMCAKAITLFYGLLCILLTFLIANFGNLIQACYTVQGMFAGPVFAVFFLGMMTTRSNEKGVIVGLVASVALVAWISFGASSTGLRPKVLSVSTADCPHTHSNLSYIVELASMNVTNDIYRYFTVAPDSFPLQEKNNLSELQSYVNKSNVANGEIERYIFPLYRISYMWYIVIGFATSVVVGYAVSLCSDLLEGKTSTTLPEYISPVLRYFIGHDESRKEKSEETNDMKSFSEANHSVL